MDFDEAEVGSVDIAQVESTDCAHNVTLSRSVIGQNQKGRRRCIDFRGKTVAKLSEG